MEENEMRKFIFAVALTVSVTATALACPYEEECYDYGGDVYGCGSAYWGGACYDQSAEVMAHWANLRDDTGAIIGTVGGGSAVEVIGQCGTNPSRTIIYDYASGSYGTVASVYLYGGSCYQYEHPCLGTGNYDYLSYNSYGSDCEYGYNYDCSYDYESSYGSGYCDDGSYYEEVYTPPMDMVYDESTPWACDNLEAYEAEEGGYVEYDYEDDDSYFSFYGDEEIWVDVDVSAQVVNIYQGNNIILSGACVTGTHGVSDTPCGQYYIMGKQQNATLVGADYECPVDYWMPFTESGCGFHDASWRDDFGGDIYEYDGSHGCVNLEEGFVQEMYEIVPEGCRVNVHGLG